MSRIAGSAVVAFYWDGSVPLPHSIRDISRTGLFVTTQERWYIGTVLHLTIDAEAVRTADCPAGWVVESMTVWAKVIRHAADGVGFEFILLKAAEQRRMVHLMETAQTLCKKHDAQ